MLICELLSTLSYLIVGCVMIKPNHVMKCWDPDNILSHAAMLHLDANHHFSDGHLMLICGEYKLLLIVSWVLVLLSMLSMGLLAHIHHKEHGRMLNRRQYGGRQVVEEVRY